MKITPQMYSEMSKDASPKSNSKVNVPVAFLIGGAICALGQLIMSVLMNCGLGKENAGTCTSIILVGLSSLLTGLGWYEKLAKHAGAGTLPLLSRHTPSAGILRRRRPCHSGRLEPYLPKLSRHSKNLAGRRSLRPQYRGRCPSISADIQFDP